MRKLLCCAMLVFQAYAEQHMVEYLLPRGAGRGEIVEVTFHGLDLDDPREVVFYRPGIRTVGFTSETLNQTTRTANGGSISKAVKVRFKIAADCPIGEHPLRLRTGTSLSEVVTFWVGPYPTVKELEKKPGQNDSIETAQLVSFNSTVNGEILPGEAMDRDYFRVEATKGQRISLEVESVRLGTLHYGGENDLSLRLLDVKGNEIATNSDNPLHGMDPLLTILAPTNGSYYVEVMQQIFSAPRQGFYRLHISDKPRPLAIYPAGGQAGEKLSATLLGDPSGELKATIQLPNAPGNFEYSNGAPSPNTLRVSPYKNVLEGEPVTSLPAALNGIISSKGEADVFSFTAKKGESWRMRMYGRTLGSPIDPKISIRSSNGKLLQQADDSTLAELGLVSSRGTWHIKDTLDPILVFKAPADGDYNITIEDTRGQGGALFVYRVEVEPLVNSVLTHITYREGYQIPRLTGLIVPQGNQWTLDVQIAPGFGNQYKGDIELEAVGLPRGVTMQAPRYKAGITVMPVQFTAAPDAEQQAALIEIFAKAVEPGVKLESGSRYGLALVNRRGLLPWHMVFLEKYALAVTKPAPFHIEIEQPQAPLAQNGELTLQVKVVRHNGFNGAVEMQPDWLPSGLSKENTVTIPAGKNGATFTVSADSKIKPGEYQIAINASTTGGDAFSGVGRIRVSSPFIKFQVTEPYLTVTLQRASVERGHRGQITGTLKHLKPFEGKAAVILKRLPNGVKLVGTVPEIMSGDTQVVFNVEASEDALAGLYKEITCEVTVKENGQLVKQQTGSGILRIDPARARSATK